MAQGNPFKAIITPDKGMAVDVITIDGVQYINNGVSEPPENSSWVQLEFQSAPPSISIQVTFAECSDDSGVPDKYKVTVTASAGEGGKVEPATQKVLAGEDATIDITPDEDMAVDTISVGDEVYVNDTLEQ